MLLRYPGSLEPRCRPSHPALPFLAVQGPAQRWGVKKQRRALARWPAAVPMPLACLFDAICCMTVVSEVAERYPALVGKDGGKFILIDLQTRMCRHTSLADELLRMKRARR